MIRLFLAVWLVVAPSAGVAREAYALLIGASEYPNLDERFWLKGPANDVRLVREFLLTQAAIPFDPAHIVTLADGVEGAKPPTLAAIRAGFAHIAAQVQPGDFVYLHFAGHGTQAPALDGRTEVDGLDELFLPVDIGPWNDTIGAVENALVDDEIGRLIGALRAKGADVWAVFDSCHSGTVTRAAPGGADVRQRQLAPAALGIPTAVAPETVADAPAPPVEGGGFTAFFAAQTNETTPERLMPRETRATLHGVFTYTLFATLAEHPGLTYRQLGQEVLRRYAAKNLARSTPMFEGDLDRIVFGAEGADPVTQWPAEPGEAGLRLAAGELHGVSVGTELAVMVSPADPTTAALGRVTVLNSTAFTSQTSLFDEDLPRGAYLRRVEAPLDLTLRIARPEEAPQIQAALELITSQQLLGVGFQFVEAGSAADLRLAVVADSPRPDAVWLLPASGLVEDWAQHPSISFADRTPMELAQVLAESLAHIARAQNLMRIGAAQPGGTLPVRVALHRARYDAGSGTIDPASRADVPGAQVPRLVPGDTVGLKVANDSDNPMDLNVLYVGSDYAITFMGNARLNAGDTYVEDLSLITDQAFGRDRLIAILTPAKPRTATEDLSFLAQDPLARTRSAAVDSGFRGLLQSAGFGQRTRGAIPLGGPASPPQPMIVQFELDTVPGGG